MINEKALNKVYKILFAINILFSFLVFLYACNDNFPDSKGYWLMGESILNGKFSSWYFLEQYYPETLRTPGYPLFLASIFSIYKSELLVKFVQYILYIFTVIYSLKIINKLTNENILAKIIFLIILTFNIQIPYYSGYIIAESGSILLLVIYFFLFIFRDKGLKYALYMGLFAGLIFQFRPSFLLFPFLLFISICIFQKSLIKFTGLHLVVFAFTLLPFSIWNYKNHGVFKPTPIEGGAGVAHIGYWIFLLPNNYTEKYYWGNNTGHDALNPFILSDSVRLSNALKFESEWNEIIFESNLLLSKKDSLSLERMKINNPGIFVLYNSEFTLKRERLLWASLIENVKENPLFYIKARIYTFFRLYFTGINYTKFTEATGFYQKFKIVLPFAITFPFIFLGFFISVLFILKNKLFELNILYMVFIVFYFSFFHSIFTIQSRYLVPVHIFVLILQSIVYSNIMLHLKHKNNL